MGDSGGQPRSFLDIKDDIRAAVDAICREIPTIRSVCLWGLCDGATAAALYAPSDPRVSGLVMANPWVHTEVTRSEALVRSYYVAKLLSLEFWRRLLGGKVALRNSLREASRAVRSVAAGGLVSSSAYVDQLVTSVSSFDGKVLVMLSEHDLVADEFRGLLRSSAIAASGFAKESVQILDIEGANHTFSRAAWRDIVASRTLRWLDGASREKAVAGVG
jgi:exosortase A-associated hydrolase 1